MGDKLREYLAQENSRGLSWSYPSEESSPVFTGPMLCSCVQYCMLEG